MLNTLFFHEIYIVLNICFNYFTEGKLSLVKGISSFNKVASAKFTELSDELKNRYEQMASEPATTQNLTETQKQRKITNIFGKLREETVR